jgi:hypothetical protein
MARIGARIGEKRREEALWAWRMMSLVGGCRGWMIMMDWADEDAEDAALKVPPAIAEDAPPRGEAKGEVEVNETGIRGWSSTSKQGMVIGYTE